MISCLKKASHQTAYIIIYEPTGYSETNVVNK